MKDWIRLGDTIVSLKDVLSFSHAPNTFIITIHYKNHDKGIANLGHSSNAHYSVERAEEDAKEYARIQKEFENLIEKFSEKA